MTTVAERSTGRWAAARPWVATGARLVLAGVFLWSGAAKVTDLAASGRAVAAYKILPYEAATVVGAALPMIELLLGLLLLAGVATRVAAGVATGLLTVFIGGIVSAWARGLSIDCGCFGGGGTLAAGQTPNYGPEIARDVALLALAAFLLVYPRTRFSLDTYIVGSEDDT